MRVQQPIGTAPRRPSAGLRATRTGIVAAAVLHAAVFAPGIFNAFYRPETMQPSLWVWYAARIPETFRVPWRPVIPHFGWTASARLVDLVLPTSDPRAAGVVVSVAAAAGFGVSLWFIFSRTDDGRRLLSPWLAVLASLFVALLESPAAIQGWMKIADPKTSFIPLYYPFVPTTLSSMGLNVIAMWMTARLLEGRLAAGRRRWLPLVLIAAALFKPNLVPMLGVVATLVALAVDLRGAPMIAGTSRPRLTPTVLRFVAAPVAIITFLQYLIITRFVSAREQGFVGIDPLFELLALGGGGWQFWVVISFPLAAALLLRGRLFADLSVSLSIGCFGIGLAAALLFARSGATPDKADTGGDILQLAGTAAAVTLIFAIRRLVVLIVERQVSKVVAFVLFLVLIPYLIAGIDTWRCHAGIGRCYPASAAGGWPQPPLLDP